MRLPSVRSGLIAVTMIISVSQLSIAQGEAPTTSKLSKLDKLVYVEKDGKYTSATVYVDLSKINFISWEPIVNAPVPNNPALQIGPYMTHLYGISGDALPIDGGIPEFLEAHKMDKKFVKLTDLTGHELWVRAAAVTAIDSNVSASSVFYTSSGAITINSKAKTGVSLGKEQREVTELCDDVLEKINLAREAP